MDTREKIYQFFVEMKKADGLEYDTELFKSKHINSLFALQMVLFLEQEFKIKLGRKDISESNFHSIEAIAALVDGKLKG